MTKKKGFSIILTKKRGIPSLHILAIAVFLPPNLLVAVLSEQVRTDSEALCIDFFIWYKLLLSKSYIEFPLMLLVFFQRIVTNVSRALL